MPSWWSNYYMCKLRCVFDSIATKLVGCTLLNRAATRLNFSYGVFIINNGFGLLIHLTLSTGTTSILRSKLHWSWSEWYIAAITRGAFNYNYNGVKYSIFPYCTFRAITSDVPSCIGQHRVYNNGRIMVKVRSEMIYFTLRKIHLTYISWHISWRSER